MVTVTIKIPLVSVSISLQPLPGIAAAWHAQRKPQKRGQHSQFLCGDTCIYGKEEGQ